MKKIILIFIPSYNVENKLAELITNILKSNFFLSYIQNIILRSNFSEFHYGCRSSKVKKFKEINFNNNSNYYHFYNKIIIRLLKKKHFILELPIPTIYKDEISPLRTIPYVLSVFWVQFYQYLNNKV
jgi:hypothetical protein